MAVTTLKDVIIRMAYPVGSIYITTKNLTVANMDSLFPSSDLTWEQIPGRMLRQATDTATSLGATGGNFNTQLITHTHSINTTNSGHTHAVKGVKDKASTKGTGRNYVWPGTRSGSGWVQSGGAHTHTIGSAGSAPSKGSNLPVYVVVKMFKRVKK